MFNKLKIAFIIIILILITFYFLPFGNLINYFKYNSYSKNNLKINLTIVNSAISKLCADSSNKLILKIDITDSFGNPVSGIPITINLSKNLGYTYPNNIRSDNYGQSIFNYIPPDYNLNDFNNGDIEISIIASILNNTKKSTINIELTSLPLIYIPGYQEGPAVFDTMNDYFTKKGFSGAILNYNSTLGIISGSKTLDEFIILQKKEYLLKGIQVKKFNLLAHSMGGLVARNYTCNNLYYKNDDVKKIIFISVPHHGSVFAPIGANYFNDQGIEDLIPDSNYQTKILTSLHNKGLNNNIETGNILGQYDEVVSPESANLENWNIEVDIFNVGENNFSVDNLLSGSLLEAPNHKIILNNLKVYKKIQEMLVKTLPFPSIVK